MYGRLSPFVGAIPEGQLDEEKTEVVGSSGGYLTRRSGRTPEQKPVEESFPADEVDLDVSLNQDLPRFVKGERVLHDTFGSGTVGEVGGFGRDLKVTVHFDTVGTKKLLVRYAGLRRDYD